MKNSGEEIKKAEMQKVEIIIGKVMQVGVFVAATVMIIGILILFVSGNSGYEGNVHPHDFNSIISGVLSLKSYAIIMSGLFLLILTPVLRVVVSIYAFVVAGDKLYVWITTAVLIILIIAMVIGMYGI
ncbi:integral membrane protein [Paucilactobacillus oligofermentans DSM 15707 = LMG 22743]|uniref:Integral membrane protein n=1 Tax=Paucilactobacillus oligofermentans DSM 15707 = LMG 22743 TaxID=1423778 RepID=A0A0R1RMT2_9LACO|nr:DUF1634 domain-containing protein [Paucilactobacillus oligofermentans]KRL54851.1 integral membrane protein [Paucilactobacillus oligofermentans DSM 15707 = LMG 22743]CUS26234.1 Putative integral membrane protein [Paucilactobacillus oligofermentans DSM 15707 = LMG 22743]